MSKKFSFEGRAHLSEFCPRTPDKTAGGRPLIPKSAFGWASLAGFACLPQAGISAPSRCPRGMNGGAPFRWPLFLRICRSFQSGQGRAELAGGEGVEGAKAGGEFGGGQATFAVEAAEKIGGGGFPFLAGGWPSIRKTASVWPTLSGLVYERVGSFSCPFLVFLF